MGYLIDATDREILCDNSPKRGGSMSAQSGATDAQIAIAEVKRYVEEWFDWTVDMDLSNISTGSTISVC